MAAANQSAGEQDVEGLLAQSHTQELASRKHKQTH